MKTSEELSITDWSDIRSCDSVHTLVEIFQLMIKLIYDTNIVQQSMSECSVTNL